MVFVCIQTGKQIKHLVQHFVRPRVRLVDLVDDDNRPEADFQSLGEHEFGLRHRAFGGIDQKDGTIHHIQNTFHFAAKIGVAGRIHNIDTRILPVQRCDLGKNGNAALALQIVGVHGAFVNLRVVAERAGGLEQHIDKSGLSMINVRDDGDISQGHFQAFKIWKNQASSHFN